MKIEFHLMFSKKILIEMGDFPKNIIKGAFKMNFGEELCLKYFTYDYTSLNFSFNKNNESAMQLKF